MFLVFTGEYTGTFPLVLATVKLVTCYLAQCVIDIYGHINGQLPFSIDNCKTESRHQRKDFVGEADNNGVAREDRVWAEVLINRVGTTSKFLGHIRRRSENI